MRIKILILGILLMLSVTVLYITTHQTTSDLTEEEAKTKVLDYVSKYMLSDATVIALSVDDRGSVYEVVVTTKTHEGFEKSLYLTKNGKTLFVGGKNVSDLDPQGELTAEEAKTKVINCFKERPITNISVVSVEEKYSVYKVITEFFGDQKTVHVSKDGKYVFSTGFNTSERPPISTPPTRTPTSPPVT